MTHPIRVLLADDHEIVREGLTHALNDAPGITLVGWAKDGAEAVRLCRQLQPDVVLLDIEMGGIDGIQAAQMIREQFPTIRSVMLTSFADQNRIQQALAAGAQGYIVKQASIRRIVEMIRSAYAGALVMSPEAEEAIQRGDPLEQHALTERERRILNLMVKGLNNNEIAEQVLFSRATVKAAVSMILEKLGARTRVEAVAIALRLGLVDDQHG
jgi:NarL family two-component system response regulator LiaR